MNLSRTFVKFKTKIILVVNCLVILLALCSFLIDSKNLALITPTQHLDGAFQTASGLFRLDAGQVLGRDFYPYLGIGPLFLLFPIFKLSGATLASSVFSSSFSLAVMMWLAISLIFHLTGKNKSFTSSLSQGAILLLSLPFLVSFGISPEVLGFPLSAGNSLKPLRAALPYAAAALIYLITNSKKPLRIRIIYGASAVALCLFWSNDFALTTSLLAAGLLGYLLTGSFSQRMLRTQLLITLVSIFLYLIGLSLITLGNAKTLLAYNFVDVGGDQWWYFGPYGSEFHISNPLETLRLIPLASFSGLFVLALLLFFGAKNKDYNLLILSFIGMSLLAGGVVASVGGHISGDYFWAFRFWSIAVAIAVSLRFLIEKFHSFFEKTAALYLVLLTSLAIILTIQSYTEWLIQRNSLRANAQLFYVPKLGGYLDVAWEDYLKFADENKSRKIVEEYWGIMSAYNRVNSDWKVDSVIHALGDTRSLSLQQLEGVDLIVSTRSSLSTDWQPWSLSQNYWFYGELLFQWTPKALSPTTVVWERDQQRKFPSISCNVDRARSKVVLKTDEVGFYELSLQYESRSKRNPVLFQNNISFPLDAQGNVSLNPKVSSETFPVSINQFGNNEFFSSVKNQDRENLTLRSCSARKISFVNGDVLFQRPLEDFYLTDGNWTKGVSKLYAGFFVPNNNYYSKNFIIGASIRLSNGEVRTITKVESSGKYLNVWLNGDIMDPAKVGIPSDFTLQRPQEDK